MRIWDVATAKASQVLTGHQDEVLCCAWSGDGKRLASAGADGTIRVWDVETLKVIRVLEGHRDWVRTCVWSGNGKHIASAGDDGIIRVWDADSAEAFLILEGHTGWVLSCAWCAEGKLASVGVDSTFRIWDAETGQEIARIEMLPNSEYASFFGPDLALTYASPGAWRWLGWLAPDPETGVITRYPAETFGPLPGPDANGGFPGK